MAGQGGAAERARSATIGPLRGLWPFVRPYRGLLWPALLALTVTAGLSLSLPIAVRRVVDNFFAESLGLVDAYFAAAIGIAALLAVGTAARFYLVTRLGERVIADIRRAIYDRVIGMSPGFYERIMTGEVLSRLTTDTTLVLSVIGSSVSVALRNVLTLVGGLALLFVTSPKLTGAGAGGGAAGGGADPDARPAAAAAVARQPGPDRRIERAGLREPARRPDGAGLSPTRRRAASAFGGADRAGLRLGAAARPHPARADDRHRDLPGLRRDRRRCSGSAPATCARGTMTAGRAGRSS